MTRFLSQIGIGLVSAFIIFPPMILVTVLFKRSRLGSKRKNRIDLGIEKGNCKYFFF